MKKIKCKTYKKKLLEKLKKHFIIKDNTIQPIEIKQIDKLIDLGNGEFLRIIRKIK